MLPAKPWRFLRGNRMRLLAHPITIFVLLQIFWVAFIVMWIIYVVNRQNELTELAANLGATFLTSNQTLVTLVAGIVLLVLILLGIVGLFVWGQKQQRMIRQQRRFVSSVTHELRTPLASLKLANETLIYRNLNEEAKAKILSLSLLDIDRLSRMVDQILVSARLDRGILLFDQDVESLDVAVQIEELIDGLRHTDSDIHSRIHIHCAENLHFKTSKTAFNLVVGNLIENACKYSAKGTLVEVDVSLDRGHLKIMIRDQGVGLEPKEQKRIFKMFHRGDVATKNAIPGTGLGLFIVKTALLQLGGVIKVASDGPGKGSAFEVHIPEFSTGVFS